MRTHIKETSNLRYCPFVSGIYRWPMNSLHKGPVTRKKSFHLKTSSWIFRLIKPSAVEVRIFEKNRVNIMVADGLAPCSVTRPLELIMYGPKFPRGKMKNCYISTVKYEYRIIFPGKNSARKMFLILWSLWIEFESIVSYQYATIITFPCLTVCT